MSELAPLPSARKRLTIVVPVYYNEENLPDTAPALLGLAKLLPETDVDVIFVDDGSGDRSFTVARELQQRWPKSISVIRLSRNFGSMNAVLAGLQASEGDCVGMISADLQDPPELFAEMYQLWLKGNKSVLAVREGREDALKDKLFANVYYYLLRKFALKDYPVKGFDLCLLDRQVVEDIKRIHEKNTSLMSLIVWLGYRPVQIPYVRRKREKGKSRWTMAKKIKLFIDAFVGFSYFPIRSVSVMGVVFAALGVLYAAFQIYSKIVHGVPVPGFATTVTLIAVTSGLQMFMLGTLGEYLWRALDEARKRPPYVIDEMFPKQRDGNSK
ncbi:MAG: glycosyltransferase family 2 protein [Verrucomicrobiota bacterium]